MCGRAGAQLVHAGWHGAHSIHRLRRGPSRLAEQAQTRPRGAQHRPATAAGAVVSRQSRSLFKARACHQALAQGYCQQEVRIIVAVARSSSRVAHVRGLATKVDGSRRDVHVGRTTLACNLRKFLRVSPRTTTGSSHLPSGTRDCHGCDLGPVRALSRFLTFSSV